MSWWQAPKSLQEIPNPLLGSLGWREMEEAKTSFVSQLLHPRHRVTRAAGMAAARARSPASAWTQGRHGTATEDNGEQGLSREPPWLQQELFYPSPTASEVYVAFVRKSEIGRMFMETTLYSPDKDNSSSSDTTQSGSSGTRWFEFVSQVVRGERDWREVAFAKHLPGPFLQ